MDNDVRRVMRDLESWVDMTAQLNNALSDYLKKHPMTNPSLAQTELGQLHLLCSWLDSWGKQGNDLLGVMQDAHGDPYE